MFSKKYIQNFTCIGYIYLPKKHIYRSLDCCLKRKQIVEIDVDTLKSYKKSKSVLKYTMKGKAIEYWFSCNTFNNLYSYLFKQYGGGFSGYVNISKIAFCYDLFQGYSFQKLCKLLQNSEQIESVSFKNTIQEDKFYLEVLRLQRSRKDINLIFEKKVNIVMFARRSKIEFVFSEILKTSNRCRLVEKDLTDAIEYSLFQIFMRKLKDVA